MANLHLLQQLHGYHTLYQKVIEAGPEHVDAFMKQLYEMNPRIYMIFDQDFKKRSDRAGEIKGRIERAKKNREKIKPQALKTGSPAKIVLSCPIIVKNEAKTIEDSLLSVYNAYDEFVIVDTGSTDGTQDIVKKYPKVRLIQKEFFPWRFDTARNFSLKACKGKVAGYLDGDEICATDAAILREVLLKNRKHIKCIGNIITKKYGNTWHYNTLTTEPRIFPLDGNIHFVNAVHNEISVGTKQYITDGTEVQYWHFVAEDPEKEDRRKERTQDLLDRERKEAASNPKNFRHYYMCAKMSSHVGDLSGALKWCDAGLDVYDDLPEYSRIRFGEYLLLGAHLSFALMEEIQDPVEKSNLLSKAIRYAGKHNGLFGDCADNCFYAYCVFCDHNPRTAMEYIDKYLDLVADECKRPLWLQNTLRYYDDMVLRREILKYVLEQG